MRAEILSTIRENARKRFAGVWRESIKRRAKRRPSVWARDVRRMPIGGPVSGQQVVPYAHEYMPHCVEQMDAADDPGVRMIVIMEGVREGKTNGVCMNIMGRTVTDAPCGIFSVHPTDSDVEKFSADDVEPMIELCLGGYFVEKKSRDSGRTKDFKKFRGGSLRIVSAGSITKFRGSTVGALFLHEADALEPESIYKAFGRTQGLADAVIVMESTPTYAPDIDPVTGKKTYHSVIHEHYEKGDMRKWFVKCAECGHLQVIRYGHFRYPPGRMAETLCHCEKCDHGHDEAAWRKMAAEGRWYATAGLSDEQAADIEHTHHLARSKQPEVRSYWRNGFTSLLPKSKGYATKLHQFVAEGEAAKTSPEALKTWTNEIAAELWTASSVTPSPPWRPIFDRREKYTKVPRGGLFLAASVDCQLNRLEVLWRVHGRNDESWGMDHVVLDGHIRDKYVWQDLRRELARQFEHELGCKIGLGFALIDAGKSWGDHVPLFFRELSNNPVEGVTGKVKACKGVGRNRMPIIGNVWGNVSGALKGVHVGVWEAKDTLYDRFRMTPEADDARSGIMHWNEAFKEPYFQGMTCENLKVEIKMGEEVRSYVNPPGMRNEPLDLEVYNLAAVRHRPKTESVWARLEADLIEKAATAEKAAKPAQKPTPAPLIASRVSAARGGW